MPAKHRSDARIGEASYRLGAMERLEEARILLASGHLAGCIYLAGRGVEGMLRAVIWLRDAEVRTGKKSLDTGHDLRELLLRVRGLGLLTGGARDEVIVARIQRVAQLWSNKMRFLGSRAVQARWRELGEVTKRRSFKQASGAFYADCTIIIMQCEALCRH